MHLQGRLISTVPRALFVVTGEFLVRPKKIGVFLKIFSVVVRSSGACRRSGGDASPSSPTVAAAVIAIAVVWRALVSVGDVRSTQVCSTVPSLPQYACMSVGSHLDSGCVRSGGSGYPM